MDPTAVAGPCTSWWQDLFAFLQPMQNALTQAIVLYALWRFRRETNGHGAARAGAGADKP